MMIDKVKQIIAKEFGINESTINDNDHLKYDIGINSLEMADLIFVIEEEMGIFLGDDASEFDTVRDLADAVTKASDASKEL
ncbi:MAG: acyl carrier protein [Clostridiales bacterium]|nr:acyl carrier protein [Clostridiales bacterium]